MDWDRHAVGEVLQTARSNKGWTMRRLSEESGVGIAVVSKLEKGLNRRVPNRDTQAKLEQALGVSLPVPRDGQQSVFIYVPESKQYLLDEAVRKFPGSRSGAIMAALEEWSAHEKKLAKWQKEHGGVT
ncbi:MAG TPA: helix-turn-helix transcriptional regulator [Armatimonadota bacterium]|nr:helix-turn-helix transcriptional regulator [Armatimonadota bacterium]